ncbi:Hypothetical predicted protein [Pelobates cultripes]|uniref:Uncharacterized protein n=1 Tax=Pelobates cultripes TaxID=61616 RepID=A0AAD1TDR9_PELCU|nr:Hypothetical predicted protein [Pelobates cultripes]
MTASLLTRPRSLTTASKMAGAMCADGTENTSLLASINSKTAPDVRSRHMGKRQNPWQSSQPLKPPSRDTGGSKRRETAAAPIGQNFKQRLFLPGVTAPSTQRDTLISGPTQCSPTIQPATEQPGKWQIPYNMVNTIQRMTVSSKPTTARLLLRGTNGQNIS